MMSSPFQNAEIPGMGSMNDPLGFVKKLWGDMQLPGMVTPTMSVDELDKKIKDLKTVESWLNVNMNMLRGTIQALEVQRATIATLKSMGESFAQQMNSASSSGGSTAAPTEAKSNAAWPMPKQEPESAKVDEKEPAPPQVKPAAEPPANHKAEASAAPFANPAAWWGLLQDQFKQAVSKAMENEPADIAVARPASKTSKAAPAANGVKSENTKEPVKTRTKAPAKTAVKTVAKKTEASTKTASKRAATK